MIAFLISSSAVATMALQGTPAAAPIDLLCVGRDDRFVTRTTKVRMSDGSVKDKSESMRVPFDNAIRIKVVGDSGQALIPDAMLAGHGKLYVATYSRDSTEDGCNRMFASRPSSTISPLSLTTNPFVIFGFVGARQFERLTAAGKDFYSTENILSNPFTKQTMWQGIDITTFRASDDLTIKNIISYGELKDNSRTAVFGTAFDLSDFNPDDQGLMT